MTARPFDFADRAALAIIADLNDRRGFHVDTLEAHLRREIRRVFAVCIRAAALDGSAGDPKCSPLEIMMAARKHVRAAVKTKKSMED